MIVIDLAWRRKDDGPVHYLVNGADVGEGDEGFDAVLRLVRDNPGASVTVNAGVSPLGGESLEGSTPFADRYGELVEALGERSLGWSLLGPERSAK